MNRFLIARTQFLLAFVACFAAAVPDQDCEAARPNILVAISDDQSYPHASAYGYSAIETPGFDRVARMGVLFNNAFTPAPGCSPMRAAFLTGRQVWQIEHAGTHASSFPKNYVDYQSRLEAAGYFVGYTGKGWGPGNFRVSGRSRNPAGPSFSKRKIKSPPGISATDYAENFKQFLQARPKGQPFSFWFGGHEPHRSFDKGIGIRNGMDPKSVSVPAFLPDTPEIRSDLLDYCYEIQWFDQHLALMLDVLAENGELDNTVVVVTSDNGMAFPRAKANCYEYGIHMPLAISWPKTFPGNRVSDDLVSLIDVTSTILDVAQVRPKAGTSTLSGKSLVDLMSSKKSGVIDETRKEIFSGRERHSSSRFHSLGYPQRVIRTHDYLYIRNFRPERWPAGAPHKYGKGSYPTSEEVMAKKLGPLHAGYADIDPCPTLDFMVANRASDQWGQYLGWSVNHRPAEELYRIRVDPACLHNLAEDPGLKEVKDDLAQRLTEYLRKTEDPRVVSSDGGSVFETYPRYSRLRWFPEPDWVTEGKAKVPVQDWLEEKRPQ